MNATRVIGTVVTVSVSTLLLSCSGARDKPRVVDVEHERVLLPSWEDYRQQAIRPAVNGKTIYALDGDQFTDSETTLREYYDQLISTKPERKLAVFRRLSTGFEPVFVGNAALDIKYCVSDHFQNYSPNSKAPIIDAMALATRAWQDVANLRFVYVPAEDSNCTDQNSAVEFAVVPSTHSSYSGCAANKMMWLSLGCPLTGPLTATLAKGVLAVNLPLLQSYVSTQGLLMHELGHMLGFRHEHPWGAGGCGGGEKQTYDAGTEDFTGRRLTNYDIPSVMHYQGVCGKGQVDYTVSALDGEGSRSIYGMPAAWYVPLANLR
jgi:hypothetical protein